jgi:transcriptional regulator with XRE-family HTH domain
MQASEIKKNRKKLKLNQAEFGNLLGVHHVTVSKWESGHPSPTPYQQTLIENFGEAADTEEVKQANISNILIKAGAFVALALLLKHLMKGK